MFSTAAIEKLFILGKDNGLDIEDIQKELWDIIIFAKTSTDREAYLLDKLEEYKTLLKEIEWIKDEGNGCYYCPVCERDKESGHKEDCKLHELIK